MTGQILAASGTSEVQREVARRLLGQLPEEPIHVVGHSFGGQVALELALLAPDRVRHLTILCSRHTPFPAFAAAADALSSGSAPDIDGTLQRWFTADELVDESVAVRCAREQLRGADRQSWSIALNAIATFDRSGETPELSTPTSLICAGLDQVSTPAVMSELAASIPGATMRIVDEWAHMSPFVAPAVLAGMLETGTPRFR